ncbi:uncharacterized protein LOC143276461 [Babylonia areolata]|uniref:uncharacterized protein LOC143276461 n=1 Tax=Babylonia areolata TaxID=304850 RepID=UPI003FCF2A61
MASGLPLGTFLWGVLFCGVCPLTAGFQWQRQETLMVTGCVGSQVTLPWAFTKQPDESVGTIHWFRFSRETLASLVEGRVTNPDKRFTPSGANADLTISGLTARDTGHYEVDVKILTKNAKGEQSEERFSATAILTVGDPPAISGDKLTIEEVTSDETCALKRQVTLRCGHFKERGVPPIDVVWRDPAGQQLPSSRYSDGNFDLDLPSRPLAGNYTCHVQCQNPVLQCLAAGSPLLKSPRLHLRPPSSEGCADEDRRRHEEGGEDSGLVPDSRTLQSLESNVTKIQQDLITLQDEQEKLKSDDEKRAENFRIKVEELRELVVVSNQQSSGAEVHFLKQTLQNVQNTLREVQQNLTSLHQERNQEKQQRDQEQNEHIQNALDELRTKQDLNTKSVESLQDDLKALSMGLSMTQKTLSSLQEALNLNVAPAMSEEHAQNFTDLWDNISGLADLHGNVSQELRGVSEAQQTFGKQQETLTQNLNALSSRVDGVEQGLRRRVERAVRECNATHSELGRLGWRLQRVESGQSDQPAAAGEEKAMEPLTDPLVSKAVPTFSMLSPWDGQSDSLLHDFVITPDGQVVIADRYHAYVIMAPNASSSDVVTRPLRYGTHIRRMTTLPDGLVACTVDDHYILLLDTTTSDPDAQERWVQTPDTYHGIAARSAQTLFVGVDGDGDGDVSKAHVDVISVVDDVAAVVTTVLNGSVLRTPAGLTVHEDELYVSDWDSGTVLRLSLDTLKVTVLTGPRAEPNLRFFQPRATAIDASGNMYVTTGGRMCRDMGVGGGVHNVYDGGFCVVVISQEGWWERLVIRGQHIYPYGLSLTPTGLAVSWGSWVRSPMRSLVQWYDLIPPDA